MSEGTENPWLVFFLPSPKTDKGSNFHVIAQRSMQADLRQHVICGILQNAIPTSRI